MSRKMLAIRPSSLSMPETGPDKPGSIPSFPHLIPEPNTVTGRFRDGLQELVDSKSCINAPDM